MHSSKHGKAGNLKCSSYGPEVTRKRSVTLVKRPFSGGIYIIRPYKCKRVIKNLDQLFISAERFVRD